MKLTTPLVLASRSPRRRKLLKQLGFDFVVHESDVDESSDGEEAPEALVKSLSKRKAQHVADLHEEALILAADTIVYLDGMIMGKPNDHDEAAEQLRLLSDNTHSVYTAFTLVHTSTQRVVQRAEETVVQFAPLNDEEIKAYVATGSPMDKAGGYGIQDEWGAVFVRSINGDYNTVVGLPLHRLYQALRSNFPDFLEL